MKLRLLCLLKSGRSRYRLPFELRTCRRLVHGSALPRLRHVQLTHRHEHVGAFAARFAELGSAR